jgi:hypothetical protein
MAATDEWWLDPDVPEPWVGIPSAYLSTPAFAARLLRMIAQQERAGATAADVVYVVRRHCRELAADLYPWRRREEGE